MGISKDPKYHTDGNLLMAKRNFLMLAHTFKPGKHFPGGMFLSEKLDGIRCYWDGGISRGIPKANVPYANHDRTIGILNSLLQRDYGHV